MTTSGDLLAERRRELERRLAGLSAEQRAALSNASAPAASSGAGIPRRAAGVPAPLSFAQELLWMLQSATPGMYGYNVPRTVRVRGPLDVSALQRALDALVERHEVLRTTFAHVDGSARQIVGEPRSVALERVDLRGVPAAEREAEAMRLVREATRRPFDLSADLLLRAGILELADDDHVIHIVSHHVASDAWSRNIFLSELSELYAGFRAGTPAALPPLAIQYGDFAAWQRERLSGRHADELIGYWRTELEGAPTRVELPTDRPHGATPSFDGASRTRRMSRRLLDDLRALSQANRATLFMTLLAAFDVLLARYSGQDDIVVGSPISGRMHAGTEAVMGYFADTLVLRTRMHDDPAFLDVLARVRTAALGAYDHREIPYEKLALELQRSEGATTSQLFNVMFTLQGGEQRPFQLAGVTASPFGAGRGATHFDLSLFTYEREDGLHAAFEYRPGLFDEETIDRMLAHFEVLLEGIVARPEQPVRLLPLLTGDERDTLVVGWNATAVPVPAVTLRDLIAEQVQRTPSAIAVEWASDAGERSSLTFEELGQRARALAERLRALGVGPGVGVAIVAERGVELVVAMVGVLEAGAYYVPLDTDYPADRLAFMLEDAGTPVVITTPGASTHLAHVSGLDGTRDGRTTIVLDGGTVVMPGESAVRASVAATTAAATLDDLAYVIYTSGSTGRPKGVQIPHRAVVNYLTWMQRAYDVGAGDAILQKAPASFDASVWELFLPLVSGARLVLARPGVHRDPARLLHVLRDHDVSILQLVPSQLQMLLEDDDAHDAASGLSRLRRLFLGGEALPSELLARLADACPALPVTNLYGPTETTVYSTYWDLDRTVWSAGAAVPIGRPIANTAIYVTDTALQLVPVGLPGEVVIGGAGVARGYLHRPDLTADKFVADPFGSGRLYRTGDRARYRSDGTLEYLGRIDAQVKLRGVRIELGEIEAALALQPEVQLATVIVREDTPGDQRLIAYCVAASPCGAADTLALSQTLRQRLKATLPVFMLPTAFVWISSWPLNANGKLDRSALPAPAESDIVAVAPFVAPRSASERAIALAWQEVLQRDRVGVNDDFFELGGHSLSALRISARVHDALGVRLPLQVILERGTVAAMAQAADAQRAFGTTGDAAIGRVSRDAFRRTRSGPDLAGDAARAHGKGDEI